MQGACKKQFQTGYAYQGFVVKNKELVLKLLCRGGGGVRDGAAVSGVRKSTVLSFIKTTAAGSGCTPKKQTYRRAQIDEQWWYVGRKDKKVWMRYASAVDEDELIAFRWEGEAAGR